jgi:hypothetical protein
MSSIWCNMAAFAVVFLYCFWRNYQDILQRKQQQTRSRVAYMLWVMADSIDDLEPSYYTS